MLRRALALCAVLAACGGDDDAAGMDASPDAAALVDAPPADARPDISGTYAFQLAAAPFDPVGARPNVIVVLPPGYDPTPPLAVLVFLHDFYNCVENVVGEADSSCDPEAATPARPAYALAGQADDWDRNVMLVVPQLAFDEASGDPGRLADAGGFEALLVETLAALESQIGDASVADVDRVVVVAHGGAYLAAAAIADIGGVALDELFLLDGLLGENATFDDWAKGDLPSMAPPPVRRFGSFYTATGGALTESESMADRAATWVSAQAGVIIDDRGSSTWPEDTYQHGLLFKRCLQSHDDLPRTLLTPLVHTSMVPAIAP